MNSPSDFIVIEVWLIDAGTICLFSPMSIPFSLCVLAWTTLPAIRLGVFVY